MDGYEPDRVRRHGGHAVVIGASIAGLLAARVLADAFERVTVVDRDPLPTDGDARRGVPQGRHIHVLLVAGQTIMETLVPGFTDELVASGALKIDFSRDVWVHAAGGFLAPGTGEMPLYYASRPLIERTLRSCVARHDRVTVEPGHQVADLAVTGDRAIEGVVVRHDGSERKLPAELVVDTTGRGSRTGTWLQQLGYAVPTREQIHVDLVYRTCRIHRPSHDRRAMLILPAAPRARGAAVAPIENDRWIVTLFGMHGDHPPGNVDELREFAAGLPTAVVRELLDEYELETPDIAHYRFPAYTRRRYEQLEDHPAGLLSLGDAVANFNPIYGQGMSVAAQEALALHHTLAERGLADLGGRFYSRVDKIVENAWSVATGGDFQFPQTSGAKPRGTDLLNRYVTRLHRKAHTDSMLADAFARVAALEKPPTSLLHPSIAWRVLWPGVPDQSTTSGSGAAA
ncbi:MAG: FAD-dependent oxidoreductase [Actinomycetota bacterium]